ncbi:MAG: DAK2 domain-containing protein, partial [Clostridia bacterium]|nr:DAK2 domain-containing protein [Clostridia bacterium]
MENYVNGRLFRSLIISGLKNLELHRDVVNELNVFPVPDGDTGTNMCMTLANGVSAIKSDNTEVLSETVTAFSKSVVLGARGNSGVILSQFLRGVCDYLSAYTKATVAQFYKSFSLGVKTAYQAVMNPTEGTMLTVLRESTDYVLEKTGGGENFTLKDIISLFLQKAKVSLLNTPNLLDVLKKAGVIDSGGQGVVYFYEGMNKFLNGEKIEESAALEIPTAKKYDYSLINADTEYVFGYCTELLVQIRRGVKFDEKEFSKKLSAIGESIVISTIDDKFKIHVHTFRPEKVLSLCHEYGEYLAIKIENMDVQHISEQSECKTASAAMGERVSLATVAVSPDKKLGAVFTDMGASAIVDGGDTCNPSVGDFIKAFESVNAEEILVFPNSSNVGLTARQAAEAYKESKITVVNCTSLAECYSTLALVDYALSAIDNVDVIESAIDNVTTLTVFKAVRDAVFGDDKIAVGEYVAVEGNKLIFKNCGLVNTVVSAVENYLKEHDKEVITLFAGKSVGQADLKVIVDKLQEFTPFSDVITVLTDNPV